MSLSPTQIEDLDELTQTYFYKSKWQDISLKKQVYHMEDALGGRGGKTHSKGGKSLSFKIQVGNNGSFQRSGLFATHTSENQDKFIGGDVPWAKTLVSYNWDVDEETFQGGDETEIVDLMEANIHSAWNDWFDGMEEEMWLAPSSSSETPQRTFGIPFWIQTANATSTYGLNGGNPSGFSSGCANVSSSTYSQWANANVTYSQVDDDDFIKKFIECCDKGHFKAPHSYAELNGGSPDWGIYAAAYETIQQLRKLQKAQNESLGADLGKYSDAPIIRRMAVQWVPAMEESTSAAVRTDKAVFGVNWRKLKYVFKKGRELTKSPAIIPNKQASVRERFMWRWGQFECTDRRSQFVMVYSD